MLTREVEQDLLESKRIWRLQSGGPIPHVVYM